MFENLTEKLQRTFKNLRGQGKLTDEHLDVALAEIREALLEGDVNVGVADELLANISLKSRKPSAPQSGPARARTSRSKSSKAPSRKQSFPPATLSWWTPPAACTSTMT